MIIQRANPGLYELLSNGVMQSRIDFDRSKLKCEELAKQLADYTLQQAARRSWRIGQKEAARVVFMGYAASSQITCLELMAAKIAVSQSTSGDIPESGLDSLNTDGDSVEMALARQLVSNDSVLEQAA